MRASLPGLPAAGRYSNGHLQLARMQSPGVRTHGTGATVVRRGLAAALVRWFVGFEMFLGRRRLKPVIFPILLGFISRGYFWVRFLIFVFFS